ncbi:MAG: replication initiation protein [Flavobacterium sp.]|nr:replication initiation protein [Flavobacterium sp.]MCU0394159.1 replication initiation protein [Thermoflexibacter sp.]
MKIHYDNSKDKDYFGFIVPFISAKYDSRDRSYSNVIIKLNPDCKRLFFELANGYTSADLKAILNLKSAYSIRMYELISMYLKQKSWKIEINNLKNLLGVELGKYKSFTQFENKILFYSQKELAEHCNLFFTWEIAEKQRKKITALTFHIRSKEQQEKAEINEEIKYTIDFVKQLNPAEIAQRFHWASSKYTLTSNQLDYILSNPDMFNEFIRIDLIIESMIEKGKAPKDRTKYLAKSLGLNKVKV